MYRLCEDTIDDDAFRELHIISADATVHAERLREIERLGASIVVAMNISGADPLGAIDVYGRDVLPSLRGACSPRRSRAARSDDLAASG